MERKRNEMENETKRNELNQNEMENETKQFPPCFFFVCVCVCFFFPEDFLVPLVVAPLFAAMPNVFVPACPTWLLPPEDFFVVVVAKPVCGAMPNVVPSARCLVSLLAVKNGFQGPMGGGGVEPGSKKVGWVLERLGSTYINGVK